MHRRTLLAVSVLLAAQHFASAGGAEPVSVTLFGESLCPYCAKFTTEVAAPLFTRPDLTDIFNFSYVAFGNAVNSSEGLLCQHGPLECELNRYINCAQHLDPDQLKWFPYVACLEGSMTKAAAESCAKDTGLDYKAINSCATGKLGDELDVKAADATSSLQPGHTYVPWVVVDGIPLGAHYDALLSVICVAYQGDRPEVCKAVPPAAAGQLGVARRKWLTHDGAADTQE